MNYLLFFILFALFFWSVIQWIVWRQDVKPVRDADREARKNRSEP